MTAEILVLGTRLELFLLGVKADSECCYIGSRGAVEVGVELVLQTLVPVFLISEQMKVQRYRFLQIIGLLHRSKGVRKIGKSKRLHVG